MPKQVNNVAAMDKYLSLSREQGEQRTKMAKKTFQDGEQNQKRTGPRGASGHSSSEWVSWRRCKPVELSKFRLAVLAISLALSAAKCAEARGELGQALAFMPPQPPQQQQPQAASTASLQERCKIGAPLQWRPYLDASSKAYLAPVVAVASLEHFSLAPIQLTSGAKSAKTAQTLIASGLQPAQASIAQHAQSVNNVGVLIEATFQVRNVLRRPARGAELRAGRTVSLFYKVSASLATTSDMIALAGSVDQPNNTSKHAPSQAKRPPTPTGGECPLELTEKELSKKGGDLFKVGRDYVLFVEQAFASAPTRKLLLGAPRQQQQQQQQQQHQQQLQLQQQHQHQQATDLRLWNAFASHEPVSNQTTRSVNRVLCKSCVRPPTVRLVNSTFVSVATQQQQQQQQPQVQDQSQVAERRIKLDCRVSGFPTPWVEWFRNGKLLRNRAGRTRIRTAPWKGRPNERLSRLELNLAAGRNETGVYECRAMNVAAREPAVGTYTLLVLPAQFALFPMQQQREGGRRGGGMTNELAEEQRRAQKSATKTNKTEQTSAPATQTATAGAASQAVDSTTSTTTSAPPQPPQQADEKASAAATAPPASLPADKAGTNQSASNAQQSQQRASSKSSPVVVGQPCPREAHDNFCLNRGTCVLIGHIEEYFCNCSEGYHGHRCEYKSLGHQQNLH